MKVEHILEAVSGRAYGLLLMVPGIILVSPVGAIPGVPAVLAAFVFVISAQLLVGKSRPWVPNAIRKRGVEKKKVVKRLEKIRPYVEQIESYFKPRFTFLLINPFPALFGLICLILSLAVIPLEIIPFAVFVPGVAICLFGIGIFTNDGLLISLGLLFSALTAILAIWILTGG